MGGINVSSLDADHIITIEFGSSIGFLGGYYGHLTIKQRELTDLLASVNGNKGRKVFSLNVFPAPTRALQLPTLLRE